MGRAAIAAVALRVTGAIVVEAGVVSGDGGREVSWVRTQAAAHPWIRGMVAQLAVEQPGKLAAGGQPAPRRRPDRR